MMKKLIFLTLVCGAFAAQALDTAFLVGDDGNGRIAIFNSSEELVWEYAVSVPYQVQPLANGNILTTSARAVYEITMDKRVVWSFTRDNHEIFGAVRVGDMTVVADCTAGEVLFVDAAGVIQDSFAVTSTATGHSTMRNLTLTPQNTFLIAHLGDHVVREYAMDGTVLDSFAVSGAAYRGERLANGNTLVGHELGLKEFSSTGVVFDVVSSDIPAMGLSFGTCAYRLPDGNTVMGNWFGHGGTGKALFELDGDQEPVWSMPDGLIGNTVAFVPVSDQWVSTFMDSEPTAAINQPILFVVRNQYRGDHHNTATFFPSADNEYNDGFFQPGGALKTVDPETGAVATLLETSSGVIRDPDVHFDGDRIVFSMRQNASDSYHIYEINADGSGLTQLTSMEDVDDLDPIYMPSGKIVFTSTREPKYIQCNRHISANLYSMDADGANINQIGRSALFEDHSSLMPDGRILYTRWEYVDRNFGDAQGLWVCDPDGTGHAVYYGNNTGSPGGVLDGQVIPGTQTAVCTFSSCHDRPWGAIAILDHRKGTDGAEPVVRTWPAGLESWVGNTYNYDKFKQTPIKYEDPWPLVDPDTGVGGRYFLCSRQVSGEHMAIYLLDAEGDETLLYDEGAGTVGCYDPMPLAPRPRPLDVNVYRKHNGQDGRFYVHDVYEGTHMAGVARGDVKYLRVVEAPEKRGFNQNFWHGNGYQGPAVTWHNFITKRILGTVPVEADGSAYFSCPPSTFVFFQLLDENKQMIQSMRSGTIIQPNETQGCIGCHDNRTLAPAAYGANSLPLASMREPSQLDGWHGETRQINYLSDVQPVWDANCMACHDWGGTGAAKLVLAGDKGLFFNASYTELWRKGYTGAIGAGPAAIQPAKSWGSHNSLLMSTIRAGHNDVSLTTEELERVATWIDLNAPYYPVYYSSYPNNLSGRSPLSNAQLTTLGTLTGKNFFGMNRWNTNPGPQVCFDRPEKSPCLSGVSGTDYDTALAIIQAGQTALAATPRADMPGFQPSGTDAWRADKFADRRNREFLNQAALADGTKVYDGQPLLLVANRGAEGIDGISARVQGEVLYAVSNQVDAITVCWGSFNGGDEIGDWQYNADLPPQSEGDFELVLTGLVPGAQVYFRVFITNADGTVAAYESTTFDTRSLIDLDSDGMADAWETAHFGSSTAELSGDDWDHDGLSNEDEYWAGTDPTNAASCLVIEGLEVSGTDVAIAWQSVVNGEYTLEYSTNLTVQSWLPLTVDRAATPPQNIYTSNVPSIEARYYRVKGRRTDR